MVGLRHITGLLAAAGSGFLAGAAAISCTSDSTFNGPARPGAGQLIFPPRTGEMLVLPLEVIDGDTIRFAHLIEDRGRLYGIDAPERATDAGQAAKRRLADLLPLTPTKAQLHGPDKYGRTLITLVPAGRSLADQLVDEGLARPWDGRGPKPK